MIEFEAGICWEADSSLAGMELEVDLGVGGSFEDGALVDWRRE